MDIHNFFIDKSNLLGVTPAALKVVTLQLLAFPLALIFNTLPKTNPIPRHLFSIFASAFFYCTLFDTKGFIQMTFVSLVVYTICAKNKSASWMPYLIMVLSMSYLSYWYYLSYIFVSSSNSNLLIIITSFIKSFRWIPDRRRQFTIR